MDDKYQQIIDPMACSQVIRTGLSNSNLSRERLEFLAKLPAFLNVHLDSVKVIRVALEHIQKQIHSDTVTLYTKQKTGFSFWSIVGSDQQRSTGSITVDERSTVFRAISRRFPCYWFSNEEIEDYQLTDAYAPATVPQGLICLPIITKQGQPLGALEVLAHSPSALSVDDIPFLEQCAHQLALFLANAQLIAELKDTNEQLAQLNRRKNEMISVIAHEFLTPLNLIKNSADLLVNASLTTEQTKTTDQILQGGVERLIKLVAQVKNVSLLQQENLKIKLEEFRVSNLFDELKAQYQQICSQRKQSILFQIENSQLAAIGDRALLLIVFQNLITNAIRFTPDNGTIIIEAKKRALEVEFRVSDSGIGISPSEIPLIFQKFYEVANHLQHSSGDYSFKSSGLGLGLSIAQDIIKAHNSQINVQSEQDKGSKFSFALPAPH